MTKKEMHREINTKFFMFVTEKFPHYIIDDSEGYGRVYLVSEELNKDGRFDSIEYHLSRHEVVGYNDNSDQAKDDEDMMRMFLEKLVARYEL
jgi:hypothetical protein